MSIVAKTNPNLKIVIDHIAKPIMSAGKLPDSGWVQGMSSLAKYLNVFCKLSGMLTEIGPDWTQDKIARLRTMC
ncbi:MAG: amidohydrolase family protein [Rhodobacteraceae bacterium]|nr:amidohydrolase family protein [Paracoccaceae bacterium]